MTHGTAGGYSKYGCRCTSCTSAHRVRMREYRNRRMDAESSDPVATNHLENQIDPASAATDPGHGNQEGTS